MWSKLFKTDSWRDLPKDYEREYLCTRCSLSYPVEDGNWRCPWCRHLGRIIVNDWTAKKLIMAHAYKINPNLIDSRAIIETMRRKNDQD